MMLYHGSHLEIVKPDITHSRPKVDFGRGFYTTQTPSVRKSQFVDLFSQSGGHKSIFTF